MISYLSEEDNFESNNNSTRHEIDRARKNIVTLDGDTMALTTPQKTYSSTCCGREKCL
jgi:hypothetical protein